jgi:hypothetical protein
LLKPGEMLRDWQYVGKSSRDLRIDWLRGLAMTCVIVDHSRLSSLFSWFSYERFWTVTAAEVFVVLSGAVLGMVYGPKLNHGHWTTVVSRLGRRAVTLYAAFLAVTISVVLLAVAGVDVQSLTTWDDRVNGFVEFLNPQTLNAAAWRDILLMRAAPWPFQIVGLYVWLVAAAVPCLLLLRFAGWRPLLAVSWILYLWYRIAPHAVTTGQFETSFPLLAWQLLFVHGIAMGYYRDELAARVSRLPRFVPLAACTASVAFVVFAFCNPWTEGPGVLHWTLVSPERFAALYSDYFTLSDLGIGRLLNLAVSLPVGYAALSTLWRVARPFGTVFITLGQQSLGAFVLHVYAVLAMAHMSPASGIWTNTLVQLTAILTIVGLLHAIRRFSTRRRPVMTSTPTPQPVAA